MGTGAPKMWGSKDVANAGSFIPFKQRNNKFVKNGQDEGVWPWVVNW